MTGSLLVASAVSEQIAMSNVQIFWTAFFAGLPTTIAAITAAILALRTRSEVARNTIITERTADRTDILEKQGNSLAETALRTRKALAERNYADKTSEANRIELQNAKIALDSHLNMQQRVDAMHVRKTGQEPPVAAPGEVAKAVEKVVDAAEEAAETVKEEVEKPKGT